MHETEERKICCYVWPRGKNGTLTSLGHLLLTSVRIEYSMKKHNESLRKSPNLSNFFNGSSFLCHRLSMQAQTIKLRFAKHRFLPYQKNGHVQHGQNIIRTFSSNRVYP